MKKKNTGRNSEPIVQQKDPVAGFTSKKDLTFAFVLAFIAFVLYCNTIGHSYVLDDAGVIARNEYVQQGLKGIGKIFSTEMWHFENVKLGYYRPLSIATFAIENQFFKGNPQISHLGNVFLYALTAFFLFLLLIRMFKSLHAFFAFTVTLLFIAHPIHTEVVANVKSRDEILSFLNLIIAAHTMLLAYRTEKTDYKSLFLSCVFFYLALLSKESALIGLILFPLILFFEGRYSIAQILKRVIPFLGLFLIFQIQRSQVVGSLSGMNGTDIINYPYVEAGSKLASMLMIFSWCIKLILIPYPLCYSYAYNQIPAADWTSPLAIAGLLIVVLILFIVYKTMQKKSPMALGLLLIGVMMAPAMGFVFLRGGILAERFLYAPALGFSIVISWLLFKAAKTDLKMTQPLSAAFTKEWKLSCMLLFIFCLYSFQTISRNRDWKNESSLVANDVEIATNNCQLHLHYGILLIKNGIASDDMSKRKDYFGKGLEQLNTALEINPHLPDAYYQIGQAYQKLASNYDSAIFYYNRAMMENSGYGLSYFGLATVYEVTGKQPLASYYYNKAVEANPFFTEAVSYREKHRKKTGLDVKVFPSESNLSSTELNVTEKDFSFYYEMGKEYGLKGDFVNATRCLEKAVELNPNSEDALINLSVSLGMTKNYEKSIEALHRALVISPNNVTALTNISILYNHIGDKEKGLEYQKKLESVKGRL